MVKIYGPKLTFYIFFEYCSKKEFKVYILIIGWRYRNHVLKVKL